MPELATRCDVFAAIHFRASGQQGFVTDDELRQAGLSQRATAHRITSRQMHRTLRGVVHLYLDTTQLSREQWVLARQLAAGPGARVGGLAALEAYGISRFRALAEIEILVPRQRRIKPPDARIRQVESLDDDEPTMLRGLCLPSIEWLIADLGRVLTAFQIAHVIHQAIYHRRRIGFDLDRLRRIVAGRRRVGCAVVRRAIEVHLQGSAGTRSFTEDRYVEIVQTETGRDPLVNMVVDVGDTSHEIDICLMPERLRIEIDGFQHGRIHDTNVDRVRTRMYERGDFIVLRETDYAVNHQPAACARRLRAALDLALSRDEATSRIRSRGGATSAGRR